MTCSECKHESRPGILVCPWCRHSMSRNGIVWKLRHIRFLPVLYIILVYGLIALYLYPILFTKNRHHTKTGVIILDTEVDRDFLHARISGFRSDSDVTHGAVVARTINNTYLYSAITSYDVGDPAGGISRDKYNKALEHVLETVKADKDTVYIINISLGSDSPDSTEHLLLKEILKQGAAVVAAAGNNAGLRRHYPAAYEGVIAVASVENGVRSPESNYGTYIDICASGEVKYEDYDKQFDNLLHRIVHNSGTSFAAPRVSACLAGILNKRYDMTPDQALRIIKETAAPLKKDPETEGLMGAGILDAEKAFRTADPAHVYKRVVIPVLIALTLAAFYLSLLYRSDFGTSLLRTVIGASVLMAAALIIRWFLIEGMGPIGLIIMSLLVSNIVVPLLFRFVFPVLRYTGINKEELKKEEIILDSGKMKGGTVTVRSAAAEKPEKGDHIRECPACRRYLDYGEPADLQWPEKVQTACPHCGADLEYEYEYYANGFLKNCNAALL